MAKNNLSNWSFKFSNIIWKLNNKNINPINFISNLTVKEKEYLLKNIDDCFIPFTINGGKDFRLAFKTLANSHKKELIKLYNSEIKYFKIELFFKNSELVVKKNGDLIREKKFFDIV